MIICFSSQDESLRIPNAMASDKLRQAKLADSVDEMDMDMSPMIDLVFLLLIFFMVSSHMIVTKIDKNVKPPKAKNAAVAKNSVGRIVVNIYEDGTVYDEDSNPLLEAVDIEAYVDAIYQNHREANIKSRLHVRADQEVETKYIKKVIQAAGAAGVIDVIFGAHAVD